MTAQTDTAIVRSIGLIIGGYRLAGLSWKGTHGSNYAARYMINDFQKLTTSGLYLGEIVFKAREPNEDGYALPDKYKSGSDLRDYYHVGIVTSINPLKITHCTSVPGGIAVDSKLGKWKYGGKLKGISYEGKEPVIDMKEMIVTGGLLNLRKQPSTSATVVVRIPDGATVVVEGDATGEWCKASYDGREGYVMTKFLQEVGDPDGDDIAVDRATLQDIYDTIGNWLGLRG